MAASLSPPISLRPKIKISGVGQRLVNQDRLAAARRPRLLAACSASLPAAHERRPPMHDDQMALKQAWFKEYLSWSGDHRDVEDIAERAEELAHAEIVAEDDGFTFEWEADVCHVRDTEGKLLASHRISYSDKLGEPVELRMAQAEAADAAVQSDEYQLAD
jgi:hypothetical protein